MTEDQVKSIIYDFNTTNLTLAEIGRKAGATKQVVSRITRGESWTHLSHLIDPAAKERRSQPSRIERKHWRYLPQSAPTDGDNQS